MKDQQIKAKFPALTQIINRTRAATALRIAVRSKSVGDGIEPFPGAGFTKANDEWYLGGRETSASVSWAASTFRFAVFQTDWIKRMAKEAIWHAWLVKGTLNPTLRLRMGGLRLFDAYIAAERPDLKALPRVEEDTVRQAVNWLRKSGRPDSRVGDMLIALRLVAEHVRKHADQFEGVYFEPVPPRSEFGIRVKQPDLFMHPEKVTPLEVRLQLLQAIQQEEVIHKATMERIKQQHPKSYNVIPYKPLRAIKKLLMCQLLKLMIISGRRSSHLCLLSRSDCLREAAPGEAEGVVWLRWRETKTQQGSMMECVIPAEYADIARAAVKTARELTEVLIDLAQPHHRESLFLWETALRSKSRESKALPILRVHLVEYVNGFHKGNRSIVKNSLVMRYNIRYNGEPYFIKFHGMRHARATALYQGGAGIGTIQDDMGHLSTAMTGVYVHGRDPVIAEVRRLHESNDLFGTTVPLLKDKWVKIDMVSEQDLEVWRSDGMFVHPTRYGYCVLPEAAGPCPIGDPCWIGPKGDGCSYHLLGPQALENIHDDVKLIEAQLAQRQATQPNSPIIGHFKSMIRRWERLERMVREQLHGKDAG